MGGLHVTRKGCVEGAPEVGGILKVVILASPSPLHPYRFSSCPSASLPTMPVKEKLPRNETLKVCLNTWVEFPYTGS